MAGQMMLEPSARGSGARGLAYSRFPALCIGTMGEGRVGWRRTAPRHRKFIYLARIHLPACLRSRQSTLPQLSRSDACIKMTSGERRST